MNETIDSVLTYWFGTETDAGDIVRQGKAKWWGKDEELDLEIRQRFSSAVDAVASNELDHWQESPGGLLASIICTDQFPRNIYRGSAKSFSYDKLALSLARKVVTTTRDEDLDPIRRVFVYMPFEHSEDIVMQDESIRLFTALEQSVADSERSIFSEYSRFAHRHREIIQRFGRFPHRNEILGRTSTAEEKAFLQTPGSSF